MFVYLIKSIAALTVIILLLKFEFTQSKSIRDLPDNWGGKWFPQDPAKEVDDNPSEEYTGSATTSASLTDLHDSKHGIKMGIPTPECDDGKTNLTLDWDNSPDDYLCFEPNRRFQPNLNLHPLLAIEHIPSQYTAPHRCMNESITYNEDLPTFGTHRPLWAKYGEYLYLPKQRWLHNLEHGAVVMLYHPCSNHLEVEFLKELVRHCIYRHVITPSVSVTEERPLALITWGSRLEMSKVDRNVVTTFIKKFALHGQEKTSKNGQFDEKLLIPSRVVTNKDDSELCPAVY